METVWVYLKDRFRPTKSREAITKGKHRGKVWVELYDGTRKMVTVQQLRGGVYR